MRELKPGFVVGSYRVVRALGEGGMGAVYEVEHVTLGVHYALKTFTLEKSHAELFRKRFLAASLTASPAASHRLWAWAAGLAAVLGVAVGAYFLLSPPGKKAARPAQTTAHVEDVAWLDQAFAVPGDAR